MRPSGRRTGPPAPFVTAPLRTAAPPLPAPPAAGAPAPWHARSAAEALAALAADERGLTTREAARRRAESGENTLPTPRGDGALRLLWRQVHTPLVYVLLVSAALAALMGKRGDAAVILGVVVLNALVGLGQELRAARAIDALARLVPHVVPVLRDGRRAMVPARELVPGDVALLEAGNQVAADLRLLAAHGLAVDESALTGESMPVTKSSGPAAADAALADRTGMAYAGTVVAAGAGAGVVVATGATTELGRISALLRRTSHPDTPLAQRLATIGHWLTVGVVAAAVALLAVGLARGVGALDAALVAVTLAVGAIPEGLPAIVTIALAVGVRRMARRHAAIRHLPAVETLGSTTVICTDKTGTLTRNEMTVRALWTPGGGRYVVTGAGYAPRGELLRAGRPLRALPDDVRELLLAGALCSDAALRHGGEGAADDRGADGAWGIVGDPTEGALVVAAEKLGLRVGEARREAPRLDVVPFDSARKFMASLHAAPAGGVVLVKGAPEVVVPRCTHDAAGRPVHAGSVLPVAEALAAEGHRVLALARRAAAADQGTLDGALPGSLVLLGLQAMTDPPRAEALDAVRACRAAGITVKMITGDHPRTAEAVARELGIVAGGDRGLSGAELARVPDDALPDVAERVHVFARIAPEDKLRIVRALEARGHVVAMTGDGVNDAPALRRAAIGVAMGSGTAAAQQAADVVLVDDNFASVAAAVEEGRRVYDNLVKALAFVLPTNLGQAVILVVAGLLFPVAAGQPLLPMRPTQLLWVNLVAAVALALPLALEAAEPDVMRRPPRRPNAPLFDAFILWRTAAVALLMAAGALGVFLGTLGGAAARPGAVAAAQTAAVTTVVLFQCVYVVQCRSLVASARAVGVWTNPLLYAGIGAVLALQAALVYAPPLQRLFGTAPLDAGTLGWAALAAATAVPVVAAEKWLWRRRARATRTVAPGRPPSAARRPGASPSARP